MPGAQGRGGSTCASLLCLVLPPVFSLAHLVVCVAGRDSVPEVVLLHVASALPADVQHTIFKAGMWS
jgi:hypothetical protein